MNAFAIPELSKCHCRQTKQTMNLCDWIYVPVNAVIDDCSHQKWTEIYHLLFISFTFMACYAETKLTNANAHTFFPYFFHI